MAFRRGGSSIAFEGLQRVFANSGLAAVDIVAERHFHPNEKSVKVAEYEEALAAHALVGCFREPPPVAADLSPYTVKYVLLVRDPRDCEISWYHARHLHAIENERFATLDDYIAATNNSAQYKQLVDCAKVLGASIFRYEDMFWDPAGFLAQVVSDLDLPLKQSAVDFAVMILSFSRSIQNVRAHNRSGLPYQALSSLPPRTLDLLNGHYGLLLEELGYPLKGHIGNTDSLTRRYEIDSIKRFALELAQQNSQRVAHLRSHDAVLAGLQPQIERIASNVATLASENGVRIKHLQRHDGALASLAVLQDATASLQRDALALTKQSQRQVELIEQQTAEIAELRTECDRLTHGLKAFTDERLRHAEQLQRLDATVGVLRHDVDPLKRDVPALAHENSIRINHLEKHEGELDAMRRRLADIEQWLQRTWWRRLRRI
ncbi:MAG: sulfotransferase domain-containing protein [Hyphomicrobium sp.]